jgi:hypothetical protein
MKIAFDGITIDGFGSTRYHLTDMGGFNPDPEHVSTKVPRTDYTKFISDFFKEKIRTIEFEIESTSESDWRDLKRAMLGRIRNDYTFTITDDYYDLSTSSLVTYDTYTFDGRIIAITDDPEYSQLKTKMQIQIASEDPTIYGSPEVSESISIVAAGFGFPFGFPFGFGGATNVIEVTNTGNAPVYPTITITGGGTNFTITVPTATTTDQVFEYNSTVVTGEQLIITPFPYDPTKARINGTSVIQNTNNNFDVLAVNPGVNTFVLNAVSGLDASSAANITFKPGCVGI